MTTEYYNASGTPASNADVNSPEMRAEFVAIQAMAAKLPVLAGNNSLLIAVNSGATGLEPVSDSAVRTILGLGTMAMQSASAYLLLAGGTMSGNIAMGSNKLTGLAAGSNAGDSVRYEQVLLLAGGTMSGALTLSDGSTPLSKAGGTMTGVFKAADNLFQILGSGDASKIAVFEVDGITTGTTRTITVPNKSGTMAMTSDVAISAKVGSFTRDLTAASGAQAVTGVGFTPKAVVFLSAVSSSAEMSVGATDGANMGYLEDQQNITGATWLAGSGAVIGLVQSNVDFSRAVIASMDADGFTLTWTKTGAPAGTGTVLFLALR